MATQSGKKILSLLIQMETSTFSQAASHGVLR